MSAPTVSELMQSLTVRQALEHAWIDSVAHDPGQRHEEGGWIYVQVFTGDLIVRRAHRGGKANLDVANPPLIADAVVVATFHTHPNPSAEGWEPGPSPGDTSSAWLLGVPCFIRAENGIYTTGPVSRRGGVTGGAGFPP